MRQSRGRPFTGDTIAPTRVQIRIGGTLARGDAGNVLVGNTARGSVMTAGDQAGGIVAQSIGGGGGLDSTLVPKQSNSQDEITLGGVDTAGTGGSVEVRNDGTVRTSGAYAAGVLAQSIGGGGGLVLAPADRFEVSVIAPSASSGDGGPVTVSGGGSVRTSGDGAPAIIAQSIGGGGGIVAVPGTRLSPYKPLDGGMHRGKSGQGGAVDVRAGTIETTGNNAPAIIAQSIGGGGGLVGDASIITGVRTVDGVGRGGNSDGGKVTVHAGSIHTRGSGSVGIFAQSLGGGGGLFAHGTTAQAGTAGGDGRGGDVTVSARFIQAENANAIIAQSAGSKGAGRVSVDVAPNGTVTSGGVGTTAISVLSGQEASITIGEGATVSGAYAIRAAATGNATVDNQGELSGNVQLSTGQAKVGGGIFARQPAVQLSNNGGFYPGSVVDLGGGTLVNHGLINPGGAGTFQTVQLSGRLETKYSSAVRLDRETYSSYLPRSNLELDVDFKARRADKVIASQGIALERGTVTFSATTAVPKVRIEVLFSPVGITFPNRTDSMQSWSTVALGFLLRKRGTMAADVTPIASFLGERGTLRLSMNQRDVAETVQEAWDKGKTGRFQNIYDALLPLKSLGEYEHELDRISSAPGQLLAQNQTMSTQANLNGALSCPYFASGTLLQERDCAWSRATYGSIGQGETDEVGASKASSYTFEIGAQKEIAPDWFLGGTVVHGNQWVQARDGSSSSSGESVDVTVAVHRQLGAWLFAGAFDAGVGSYDNRRIETDPGQSFVAKSKSNTYTIGGRLRAEYDIPVGSLYVRPRMDFDVVHVTVPSYSEQDAPGFDLRYHRSAQTAVRLTPAVEVGGRVAIGSATLRPFAAFGISVLPVSRWQTAASFEDAGPDVPAFSHKLSMPGVLGNISAGANLYTRAGLELKAEYDMQAGGNYLGQGGSVRFVYAF